MYFCIKILYNVINKIGKEDLKMEKEKEIVSKEENVLNDKGFSFMYNLTMVAGVATVAMFVLGTALYLTVLS